MDYFYDGQVRRYLAQFIQILSNFAYKDAKGNLVQVPVRYGDMTRQVGQILRKNSENTIPSAPFISCYIKELDFDRDRMQDPTFISTINIKERAFDENNNQYLNTQGSNYTIERIMPSPFKMILSADIWSSNTDQKLQIWEQLIVFFNPSFEIQTTDNYVDWTSLSVVTLDSIDWSSRQVPQGVTEDIDIMTITFHTPVWITPPAKVKKLGVITKIISNIFSETAQGTIASQYNISGAADVFSGTNPDTTVVVTPGNYSLLVLNGTAKLIKPSNGESIDIMSPKNVASWHTILDLYPGKFRAGLSQIRFSQANGYEVIADCMLDPSDDFNMKLNIHPESPGVPSNTIIEGRGTVDAVINPEIFNPTGIVSNTRYLILEDINNNSYYCQPDYQGPDAWKNTDGSNFQAFANDIIEWDGSAWRVVFSSGLHKDVIYITNAYTNTQYKWENGSWSKTYEGIYEPILWRLIL